MRDISSPLDGFSSPFGPQRNRTLQSLLFGQTEPGFTFEPWDITTLYQDRAGTTPVTAAGQSVGLRLDKSQGLRQGPELVTNGDFSSGLTGWSNTGSSTSIWESGAARWSTATAEFSGFRSASFATVVGRTYEFTATVLENTGSAWRIVFVNGDGSFSNGTDNYTTPGTRTARFIATQTTSFVEIRNGTAATANRLIDNISVRELAGNHEVAVSDAKRGVYGWMPKTGRRNLLNATETLSTQSVTVTAVAHTLAFTGTGTVTLSGASTSGPLVGTGASNRVTLTFTPTAGSLTLTVTGSVTLAQLQLGSVDTAYQRVASQYDVTEAGVPTCYYVQADGVDDAYVTPTITPNTDKAQVFAGVRKLVDTVGILMELSASVASNAGTFYFAAGQDVGALGTVNGYSGMSRGSAAAVALQNAQIVQAAPDYAVICFTHDIAGDLSTIRRNGIAGTNGTADKGTGNFLAYPAYIYSRGGTSLPFNGLDFGHAVRFGTNLDAATIARVESLIARNTPEVTL